MQKIILFTALLIVGLAAKVTAQSSGTYKTIEGWTYWQPSASNYEIALENNKESADHDVITVKSIQSSGTGLGATLTKNIVADFYRGKTVKMTGYIKSDKVRIKAGFWMRIDYYGVLELASDYMKNRPVKGSTDWTKYEIVLFVPIDATQISYGVSLVGKGQIWFKEMSLEIVDNSVAETGHNKGRDQKILSFETRAKAISNQIKGIVVVEKGALKDDLQLIEKDLEKGSVSKDQADALKLKKAQEHATAIDTKVAVEQQKLEQLVQDKVDGKVQYERNHLDKGNSVVFGNNSNPIGSQTEINMISMKVYNGQQDKEERQSKRTTSQLVFAAGLNNVATKGIVEKSDFKYLGSHFYELGISYNTRILPESNLLHAKYGLSLQYNNLRATDNRSFIVNGNQTNLEMNTLQQEDARFKNVNLVFPAHLEFDFTKTQQRDGKTYFKTHDSFRFGLGGFVGLNLKSKQYINYDSDSYTSRDITRGDFNTSNFIYGLSAYIGYKATSLYLKYDLNPLFKDNVIKQNNVSLGVRFDFN